MLPALLFLASVSSSEVRLGPPEALATSELALEHWAQCVINQAIRYSKLAEAAATISDASITQCASFEPKYELSLHEITIDGGPRMSDETVKRVMDNTRANFKAKAIASVLEIRLQQTGKPR